MLISRSKRKRDPYLDWKVRSFGAGAAIGLAGIFFDAGWLIGIALGVLMLGFLLRFTAHDLTDDEVEGSPEAEPS